ncbi:MAG TPA: hypothetical protein VKQ31_03625, partial [Steroidobacteraceae bacterium]|nr:hypothetical protein [Steroidobacteraceae bacterium]
MVPSRQRAHAVRLAHAAAQLAAGARVWASPDVLAAAAWTRRECERQAERAPQNFPRILSAAEECWLWREAAREAAGEAPFLSLDALAESLQRAAARAAEWDLRAERGAPESEATLFHEAERRFAARCRELGAASVSAVTGQLECAGSGKPLALRGFDALPRGILRLTAAARPHGAVRALASARGVLSSDGESERAAIASWCRARLLER